MANLAIDQVAVTASSGLGGPKSVSGRYVGHVVMLDASVGACE